MEGTTLADRLQEKVAGVCLIVGALLMAPTTFFEYSEGMLFGAGALGLLIYALLIPGLLGIATSVARGRSAAVGRRRPACHVRLRRRGSFQTALLHEWAAQTAGVTEATMAAIMDVTEGRVFPVLFILGLQFPVSLLTLSIGLFRTGVVPIWVALLLGLGAVAFPVGHVGSIQLVQHVAETLLLVPLLWLGLRSLTGPTARGVAQPVTA